MKNLFSVLLCAIFCIQVSHAQGDSVSLSELKAAILEKMDYHNIPAAGIAIVNKEGPVWIESLGIANKEKELPADENTQFRIGSVSKMFVALSILKLQREGLLSLNDKVRDLAPEIEFENQWEDEHPIRIVHLLEHTTGWDDLHLTEYANSDPKPLTLKEGLDFHPHSRKSRWIPGSRMAYCNSGPPVAAYIIEKVTGQSYEDYVVEHFFQPLKMEQATFFKTPFYDEHGAVLYQGNYPQDYWYILQRPSGSINASAKAMARFVQALLNDGVLDSNRIVTREDLRRMEMPTTTPAAQAGMKLGYGLNNYSSNHEGFIFHGHNGGVNGGLTDLGYLPEAGIGHIVMINSGNGAGFQEISKLVKDFEIKDLPKPEPVAPDTSSKTIMKIKELGGSYLSINPRNEMMHFVTRLIDISRFLVYPDGKIGVKKLWNNSGPDFYPASSFEFIHPKSGEISMVSVYDPLVGPVIHQGWQVLKPVTGIRANGPITFIIIWLLLMIILGMVTFFWFVGKSRRKSPKSELRFRVGTFVTSFLFFAFAFMIIVGGNDAFKLLANQGVFSIALFLVSILYGVAILWSVWLGFRARQEMVRPAYWFYVVLTFCQLVVFTYLTWYGVIGIRTWA